MQGQFRETLLACEQDINRIISQFQREVGQKGKTGTLETFKSVWRSSQFSFIHQARPSPNVTQDFTQALYSLALQYLQQPTKEEPPAATPQVPADVAPNAGDSFDLEDFLDFLELGESITVTGTSVAQLKTLSAADNQPSRNELGLATSAAPLCPEALDRAYGHSPAKKHTGSETLLHPQHEADEQERLAAVQQLAVSCQEQQQDGLAVLVDAVISTSGANTANVHQQLGGAQHGSSGSAELAAAQHTADQQACPSKLGGNIAAEQYAIPNTVAHQAGPSTTAGGITTQQAGPSRTAGDFAAAQQAGPSQTLPNSTAQHAAARQAGPSSLSSLEVPIECQLGALYTLYCLYHTQVVRPKVRVHMAVRYLPLLKKLVEDARGLGLSSPRLVLSSMLRERCFLFGLLAAPSPSVRREPQHVAAAGGKAPVLSGMLREALFHIKGCLKGLANWQKIGDACARYNDARGDMLRPPRRDGGRTAPAPPLIFQPDFPQRLTAMVDSTHEEVLAALVTPLPRPQPKVKRGSKRKPGEAAADAAAPAMAAGPSVVAADLAGEADLEDLEAVAALGEDGDPAGEGEGPAARPPPARRRRAAAAAAPSRWPAGLPATSAAIAADLQDLRASLGVDDDDELGGARLPPAARRVLEKKARDLELTTAVAERWFARQDAAAESDMPELPGMSVRRAPTPPVRPDLGAAHEGRGTPPAPQSTPSDLLTPAHAAADGAEGGTRRAARLHGSGAGPSRQHAASEAGPSRQMEAGPSRQQTEAGRSQQHTEAGPFRQQAAAEAGPSRRHAEEGPSRQHAKAGPSRQHAKEEVGPSRQHAAAGPSRQPAEAEAAPSRRHAAARPARQDAAAEARLSRQPAEAEAAPSRQHAAALARPLSTAAGSGKDGPAQPAAAEVCQKGQAKRSRAPGANDLKSPAARGRAAKRLKPKATTSPLGGEALADAAAGRPLVACAEAGSPQGGPGGLQLDERQLQADADAAVRMIESTLGWLDSMDQS